MGFILSCKSERFSSSYSYWNTIRSQIIFITINYIFNKNTNISNDMITELKTLLTINSGDTIVSFIQIYNKLVYILHTIIIINMIYFIYCTILSNTIIIYQPKSSMINTP